MPLEQEPGGELSIEHVEATKAALAKIESTRVPKAKAAATDKKGVRESAERRNAEPHRAQPEETHVRPPQRPQEQPPRLSLAGLKAAARARRETIQGRKLTMTTVGAGDDNV